MCSRIFSRSAPRLPIFCTIPLKSSIFISTSGPRSSTASPATLLSRATKGLAGAYNHNVLRLAEKHLAQEDDPTLFLIGQMGRAYFAERDIRVDGEFMFTVQDPTIARARDIADIFIRLFREGQLDDVYVVYTEMVTPMRLEPRVQKLLPLDIDAFPWGAAPE